MAKKAQMFVASAVFLAGLMFVVQQSLITYARLDMSRPFGYGENYMVLGVIKSVNETITTTGDCATFDSNLRELIRVLKLDFNARGYMLEMDYQLDCGDWSNSPPADAPLAFSIAFTGFYDAEGVLTFYDTVGLAG